MWAFQPLLPVVDAPKKKWKRVVSSDYLQSTAEIFTTTNFDCRSTAVNDIGNVGVCIPLLSSTNVYRVTRSGADFVFTSVTLPNSTARTLHVVLFFKGLFYVFSNGMGIFTSPDGISWTTVRTPDASGFTLYVYGCVTTNDTGTVWLAQSTNTDQMFRSTDLLTWSTLSGLAAGVQTYSMIWDGTQFVAAGSGGDNKIYTSLDGLAWTVVSTSVGDFISYYGGVYVATYDSAIKRSTNLTSWTTTYTLTSANQTKVAALTLRPPYTESNTVLFVAYDSTGKAIVSYDGTTWFNLGTSGGSNWFGYPVEPLLLGRSVFIKGGINRGLRVYPSLTWETLNLPRLKRKTGVDYLSARSVARNISAPLAGFNSVAANPEGTLHLAVPNNSYIVAVTSASPLNYTKVTFASGSIEPNSAYYSNGFFYLVKAQAGLEILRSSDLISWTTVRASDGVTVGVWGLGSDTTDSVWVTPTSVGGTYLRSTDLLTWTSHTIVPGYSGSFQLTSPRYLNGQWLINHDSKIYASTDGALTWSQVSTTNIGTYIKRIFYHNSTYFLYQGAASLIKSTNLSTWTAVTVPASLTGSAGGLCHTVRDGVSHLYIVTNKGEVALSIDDGVTWTDITEVEDTGSNYTTPPFIVGGEPFCNGYSGFYKILVMKQPKAIWTDLSDKLSYYDGSAFALAPWDSSAERPLDSVTTVPWGAYSLNRRLVSSYSGFAIKVRRASDNAERDIEFLSNRLDQATLSSFLSGTTGYITQVYDQSGNGNHIYNATTSHQPELSVATAGQEFAVFDGTDDQLQGPNFGGVSGATFFMKGTLRSTGAQALIETSDNYNSTSHTLSVYYYVTEGGMNVATSGITGSLNYARSSYGATLLNNNNVQAWRIDRSASAFVDKASLFVADVKQTRTGNSDGGTVTGNLTSSGLRIGARGTAIITLAAALDMKDLVIFNTALSDSDVGVISRALA